MYKVYDMTFKSVNRYNYKKNLMSHKVCCALSWTKTLRTTVLEKYFYQLLCCQIRPECWPNGKASSILKLEAIGTVGLLIHGTLDYNRAN